MNSTNRNFNFFMTNGIPLVHQESKRYLNMWQPELGDVENDGKKKLFSEMKSTGQIVVARERAGDKNKTHGDRRDEICTTCGGN